MSIENVSQNNLLSRFYIEQTKDLTNEEKTNLLSIFDSIDEKENDNQKGVLTTSGAINNFLEQMKNAIKDKYSKLLEQFSISSIDDKNKNGIIDESDFSKDELEKLQSNELFYVFEKQMWTPEVGRIISSVLYNINPENEDIIKVDLPTDKFGYNKHIVYDTKNKTLKSACDNGGGEYFNYEQYSYDNNGNLISSRTYETDNKYLKNGQVFALGHSSINWLIEKEGFPSLQNHVWTDEENQRYEDLFYGTYKDIVCTRENNIYDDKGNKIRSTEVHAATDSDNPVITSFDSANGYITTVEQNLQGDIISKEVDKEEEPEAN